MLPGRSGVLEGRLSSNFAYSVMQEGRHFPFFLLTVNFGPKSPFQPNIGHTRFKHFFSGKFFKFPKKSIVQTANKVDSLYELYSAFD